MNKRTDVASGLVPDDPSTHDRRQLASATPKPTSDLAQLQAQRSEPQRNRQTTWEWRLPAAFGRASRGRQAQDQTLR